MLVGLLFLSLTGCGKKEAAPQAASSKPAVPAYDGDAIRVEITGNDTMKYSLTEFSVAPGQPVTLVLTNVGTMPKFSMGHNFIVLMLGTDLDEFVAACSQFPTSDYVSTDHADRIIASTKLLGPGESDEITFMAPTDPGNYDFVCSFPGHYQVGMRGVMIVK